MNIEVLGEKITKEIRLNRAIRAQFNSLFLKTQQRVVFLENVEEDELRKGNFLDDLFRDVEKAKMKKDVCIGQVSALLKQIEVEEKYLVDYYERIKARCYLNMLALKFAEKKVEQRLAKDLEWKKRIKMLLVYLIGLTFLCLLLNLS
jgi:ribosome-binding ATPase YchF (GTP1/OBG family)